MLEMTQSNVYIPIFMLICIHSVNGWMWRKKYSLYIRNSPVHQLSEFEMDRETLHVITFTFLETSLLYAWLKDEPRLLVFVFKAHETLLQVA